MKSSTLRKKKMCVKKYLDQIRERGERMGGGGRKGSKREVERARERLGEREGGLRGKNS